MVRFHVSITQVAQMKVPFADVQEFVVRAEKLGYDGITLGDRTVLGPHDILDWSRVGLNQAHLNCLTTLASLATVTRKLILRTLVLNVPLKHPADLANIVATIDNISGGRFILTAAVGVTPDEYKAFKLPYEHRGGIMLEAVQIMKALWTHDEPISFKGKYFTLEDAKLASPKPVQKPHPPVWYGSHDAEGYRLKRVGRFFEGWDDGGMTNNTPEVLRKKLEVVRNEAKKLGRNADEIGVNHTFVMAIGKDDAEARKTADDYLLKIRGQRQNVTPAAGSPKRCTEHIRRLAEAGATDFTLSLIPYTYRENVEMMELFAKEVIPNFR